MLAFIRALLAAFLRWLGIRPAPSRPPAPSVPPAALPSPPALRLIAPVGGGYPSPVAFTYVLTDAQSNPVSLSVRFSTNGGATYAPATESATGSDGTAGLASSPGGVRHTFMWDARTDLGGRAAVAVLMDLTPSAVGRGATVTTAPFDVLATAPAAATAAPAAAASGGATTATAGAGVTSLTPPAPASSASGSGSATSSASTLTPPASSAPPAPSASAIAPPEVFAFDMLSDLGPLVPVTFIVSDPQDELVDISVEYSVGGGGFSAATRGPGSDGTRRIAASSRGVDYRFMWNAGADLGANVQKSGVVLRVSASNGIATGSAVTGAFNVDTTDPRKFPTNTLQSPMPVTMKIIGGKDQKGLAGYRLAEALMVQVLDRNAQPLPGVEVTYRVLPASTVQATFETHPSYGPVTGASGMAAVWVRPQSGVTGSLEIQASIVGVPETLFPAATAKFTQTVNQAKLVADTQNPSGPLQLGQIYRFRFYLDGDGDWNTVDFSGEPDRPVRFHVDVTNAHVDLPDPVVPVPPFTLGNAIDFSLTPTTLDQDITLKVSAPGDATIAPWTPPAPLKVKTDANVARVTGIRPVTTAKFRLLLRAVSGDDPVTHLPQRGYPGLTLDTAYRVALKDDAGEAYERRLLTTTPECGPTTSDDLPVFWSAVGGVVATSRTPGTPTLAAPVTVNQDVFFRPTGPGPWQLFASVDTSVLDRHPNTFHWTDTATPPQSHCSREDGLYVSTAHVFFVHPATLELQDATGRVVESIAPGLTGKLVARNLSPGAAGVMPDEIELNGIRADGADVAAYTGLPGKFKQKITMRRAAPDRLESDEVLFVAGKPEITGTPLVQMFLPRARLLAQAAGLRLVLPTAGRTYRRASAPGVASVQETVMETTPYQGFDGSVQLAGGELVRAVTDLTFVSRGGTVAFTRTYRGHLLGDGVLGPGWVFQYECALDVSQGWGVRLLDGTGRLHHFLNAAAPRGLYVDVKTHTAIDQDHGAVELVDRHQASTHFNVDGSLRFVVDRHGNRLTFGYNTKGQVTRVTDALDRVVTLEYHPDTATPKELAGRLRKITDHDTREVEFQYYDAAGPAGRPGWLKKVLRPKAPTQVGGAEVADYRRAESYKYKLAADPALDGLLEEVLDSEDQVVVKNEYPTDRKVEKQTYGGASTTIEYQPTTRVVKDRAANKRTWTFKASPYPDAATPESVVEHANGARPGQADLTTTLTHNDHGEVTRVTHPGGLVMEYVYQDDSPYVRSRGNLLLVRQRGTGAERVWTWTYEPRFNLPLEYVPARGNAPDGVPRLYSTRHVYDYQLSAVSKGNVVETRGPRTLNALMMKNATGGDHLRYVHETACVKASYNDFGLVTSTEDVQGVVTTYEYYPVSNPYGGPGVATSAGGGGFLGKVTRDTQVTTQRDLYLPGVPLKPLSTSFTYDRRGDLATWTDEAGVTHRTECNALRQVRRLVYGDAMPAGATFAAQKLEVNLKYGPHGLMVRREIEQPGADPMAGGATLPIGYAFDAEGHLTRTDDQSEAGIPLPERYGYDGEGLPTKIESPAAVLGARPGQAVEVKRDGRGLPATITVSGAGGALDSTVNYTDGGALLASADGSGARFGLTHDAFGQPMSIADDAQHEIIGLPNSEGDHTRVALQQTTSTGAVDVFGFVEHRLDEQGRLRRTHRGVLAPAPRAAAGATSAPMADAPDAHPDIPGRTWPPVATSPLKDEGKFGRGDGRATTDTLLDAHGRLTRMVDDENRMLALYRDAHGKVTESLHDTGPRVTTKYTAANDLEQASIVETGTDPTLPGTRTLKTRYDRDALRRPVRVVDALGQAIGFGYDARGRIVSLTDARAAKGTDTFDQVKINKPGNVTHFYRNARGRLRKIETEMKPGGQGDAAGKETNPFNVDALVSREFLYDANGQFNGVKDRAGRVSEFKTDDLFRCTDVVRPGSTATPGGATTKFAYDGQGRVERCTDPNGVQLKFSYDALNRLQELKVETPGVAGTQGYTYTYDESDRLKTATELGTGRTMEMHYDAEGKLAHELQAGRRVGYNYNGVGQRKLIEYPATASGTVLSVESRYDDAGRLKALEATAGLLATYQYVGLHALQSRVTGPLSLKITYDAAGRLFRMGVDGMTPGAVLDFSTDRDADGRTTRYGRTVRYQGTPLGLDESRTFEYDSAGRCVSEDAQLIRQRDSVKQVRWFDGDGALRQIDVTATRGTSVTRSTIALTAEERGRIQTRDGVTLKYDAAGQLIEDGTFSYRYDVFGRVIRVEELATHDVTEYQYDGLGRRVARRRGQELEEYVYNVWNLIEVRVGGEVRERYFWGRAQDELVGVELAGTLYQVACAPDGSIDTLTDRNGNIVETYDYSLTGEVTLLDDGRRPKAGAPRSRILFHGKPYDATTRLMDFRNRTYCPRWGQFLTADPHHNAACANQYALAGHDPVNATDHYGLEDSGIDWWQFGKSLGKTLAIGVLIVGCGAALLVAGVPLAVVGAVGLAVTAGVATLHATERGAAGQSLGESLFGGVADTFGVSGIVAGGFDYDIATWKKLNLSRKRRGEALGSGVGAVVLIFAGGRVLKGAYVRGPLIRAAIRARFTRVRIVQTQGTSSAMVIARSGPDRVRPFEHYAHSGSGAEYPEAVVIRPRTLDDFVDVIQARLHSMPRPGPRANFRESSLIRLRSIKDGRVMGSDLVLQTRNGGGLIDQIPEAVERPLFDAAEGLISRNASLQFVGRMHGHPPDIFGAIGHSFGDMNVLEAFFFRPNIRPRVAPGFEPFVVRIGENGAPQEVTYVDLFPDVPEAPASTVTPPPSPLLYGGTVPGGSAVYAGEDDDDDGD